MPKDVPWNTRVIKGALRMALYHFKPDCHTQLHLGYSATLRIWQVPAFKMEPQIVFRGACLSSSGPVSHSVCLSVCLSEGHTFLTVLKFFKI